MATVYIVRHGNTFDPGDTVLRVGGGTDLPLSVSGMSQARSLGERFADVRFDKALVSPLRRTRMTADEILRKQTAPPEPEFTASLVEVDYGPDEGMPESDVVARIGEDALQAWERDAVVPPGWNIDPEAMKTAWSRMLNGLSGTTLVVTSNGVARFVLDVVAPAGVQRKLKTGAYGILEGSGRHWNVVDWNVQP